MPVLHFTFHSLQFVNANNSGQGSNGIKYTACIKVWDQNFDVRKRGKQCLSANGQGERQSKGQSGGAGEARSL